MSFGSRREETREQMSRKLWNIAYTTVKLCPDNEERDGAIIGLLEAVALVLGHTAFNALNTKRPSNLKNLVITSVVDGTERTLEHHTKGCGDSECKLVQNVKLVLAELRAQQDSEPDPEWERIEKLSDDEVKAELIADGVYKDDADIAEHAAKFTLRVHEMLRMKKAGERIGREKLSALEAENKRLRDGFRHIAETCVEDPDTAQFASRFPDGSAELP